MWGGGVIPFFLRGMKPEQNQKVMIETANYLRTFWPA